MRNFTYTNHAFKRIKERQIPYPDNLTLRCPGRKTRKKIRDACVKNGYKREYVFYIHTSNKNIFVYVCLSTDIGKFLIITAFLLK